MNGAAIERKPVKRRAPLVIALLQQALALICGGLVSSGFDGLVVHGLAAATTAQTPFTLTDDHDYI